LRGFFLSMFWQSQEKKVVQRSLIEVPIARNRLGAYVI
jgi:hypothetical protein